MTKPRNLVLTGFMGTGKTTVGQLVADFIGWSFLDADDEIVHRTGMSIPEIFAQQGEAGFRQIERVICQSLAARENVVIATGGGMLMDESNRTLMLASGMVICLTASVEALEERLVGDTNRPMLTKNGGDWRGLLERRRPIYEALPIQVDTTGKSPQDVAMEVIWLWRSVSG